MEQEKLFANEMKKPLACRMRPTSLHEFYGQSHLVGKGKLVWRMVQQDEVSSMILWDPRQ